MSHIDDNTVINIARLARVELGEAEIKKYQGELSAIIDWAEQLNELDTKDIEPTSHVVAMKPNIGEDKVTDGDISDKILSNAPDKFDSFFAVAKVIE